MYAKNVIIVGLGISVSMLLFHCCVTCLNVSSFFLGGDSLPEL